MNNPSSTSNSKPEFGSTRRLWVFAMAFLASFLLLTVLNLLVARATLPYKADSRLGPVVRYLRYESSLRIDSPSVIFMGSSRFNSCIQPDVFDACAVRQGLNARFLNVTHAAMGSWEFAKLVSWIDLGAMNTRVCVVEVNPWTFNKHITYANKRLFPYCREVASWGTLREVWSVKGLVTKCKLVLSMVLARKSVGDWVDIGERSYGSDDVVTHLPAPFYHSDREKEVVLRDNPGRRAENISKLHMWRYQFSAEKRDQFLAFIALLEAQGIAVVLVQPPVRESYFDYVKESTERFDEYQKHVAFMTDVSKDVSVFFWQVPKDAGLNEHVFVDYGHFSLDGASVFSGILAGRMEDIIAQLNGRE